MPTKNKKEFKESNFLNTKEAETVVAIADRVMEARSIRKAYLRNIIGGKSKTFTKALQYLIDVALLEQVSKYPPDKRNKAQMGRKYIYINWKGFESLETVDSVMSLTAFQKIDLNRYPIRDFDKISEEGKLILKKYLFRIIHKSDKISSAKMKKVFDLLTVEAPCKLSSIRRLYNLSAPEIYGCIGKLIESGKVELGHIKNSKTIVIYKSVDWVFAHSRWKCYNCGYWNPGNNNYCGKCAASRDEKNDV